MGIFAEVEKVMRSKRFKHNVLNVAAPLGLIEETHDVNTDDELDAILKSVYVNMPNKSVKIIAINDIAGNTTFSGGQTHVTLNKYTDSWGTIKSIRYGLSNLVSMELMRNIYNGQWQDWSWNNPPMNVGVEYRTSEHYKGKPIYRKLIEYTFTDNVGDISTYTDITIPTNIEDDCDIIKLNITNNWGARFPYGTVSGGLTGIVQATKSTGIILRIYKDVWSPQTLSIELDYVKK